MLRDAPTTQRRQSGHRWSTSSRRTTGRSAPSALSLLRLVRWSTRSSIKYAVLISVANASEVRAFSYLPGARILRAARRPARRKDSEKKLMRQVRQTNHDFKRNKAYDIPFEAVNVFGFRNFGQGLRSSRN